MNGSDPQTTPLAQARVVTTSLNVRTQPSTRGQIMKRLRAGDVVPVYQMVTDKYGSEWAAVRVRQYLQSIDGADYQPPVMTWFADAWIALEYKGQVLARIIEQGKVG